MSDSRAMAIADIQRIESSLFFEPPRMREKLIRFAVLITMASVIASGGLISDSVASVIGAMIISPLMTPIMGMVVAIIMGSMARTVRSGILVAVGIGIAVSVGWLMAKFMPGAWNPLTSDQVMARTQPHLLDLVVALASGAAGAYALSRSDIADSLPGVAIAISLVPPLNNAGILLATGEHTLASQSFLLFATNFIAILLAGTITFVLTGLALGVGRTPRELGKALLVIVALIVLIAVPLAANSNYFWTDVNREDDALAAVEQWLDGSDWEVYDVEVESEEAEMTMVLGGEGTLPDTASIVAELTEIMDGEITLTARVLGVRTETISESAQGSSEPGG